MNEWLNATKDRLKSWKIKGSRSHLQISFNITKLCKDDKYTINYDDVYEILKL